jgi:hypothetical protein
MHQDSHARIDSYTSRQQWSSGSGTLSIFVVEMGLFCKGYRLGGLLQPMSHSYDDLALGWDLWQYLWFTSISARSKSGLERS